MKYPAFTGAEPCVGAEEYVFFREANAGYEYREAARLCGHCPMSEPCREYAIRHESDGYWNSTPSERSAERKYRNIILDIPHLRYART